MKTIEERFWSKVDKSGDCWIWTAYAHPSRDFRYGQFTIGRKKLRAHRLSYEMKYGKIPDGYAIDHICHNTMCVNPSHLRPVTAKQNSEHQFGASKNSKTGVRGVYIEARGNGLRYRAAVRHNRQVHTVGSFETLEEAESAVASKRLELFTHNDQDRMARTNQGENK